MREVLRTNDLVRMSFAQALLRDAQIETVVLDQHASVMDGSVIAVRRRLMVADEDASEAAALLRAGLAE